MLIVSTLMVSHIISWWKLKITYVMIELFRLNEKNLLANFVVKPYLNAENINIEVMSFLTAKLQCLG